MGSLVNVSVVAVLFVLVSMCLVFLWLLGRGVLRTQERSVRAMRRAAQVVTAVLAATAVVGLIVNLAAPSVTMTVPMANTWPLPLPGVELDPPQATIEHVGVALTELSLSGVSVQARILWSFGQFLTILLPTTVALLVALALRQLERGAAFSPVVARTTITTAMVVLVAGTAGPALRGIAGSIASHEALYFGGAAFTGYPDDWSPMDVLPQPTVSVSLEVWPVGVAVALCAVAAIIRVGSRLQRDTEGLV